MAQGGDSFMAVHFIDRLELNLGIQLTTLIHSVLYNSYAETLNKLKELLCNHENYVPICVLKKHNEDDKKNEITKKFFLKSDLPVKFYFDNGTDKNLIEKHKMHLDNNETSNSVQNLKTFSKQGDTNDVKESYADGRFGSNSMLLEKRSMLKSEYQVPSKLIKKENMESGYVVDDKDLHSTDKSQTTCNHKKKKFNVLWDFNTGKCVDASPAICLSE